MSLALVWTVFVALLGLAIGSFLTVVISRVPAGQSVVSPPSACPRCGKRLAWWVNIPVLAWIALRGRSVCCATPIPWMYPAVELLTGLSFLAVWAWQGMHFMTINYLVFAAICVALSVIDLQTYRLPDAIVLPSIAFFSLSVPLAVYLDDGRFAWTAWLGGILFSGTLFALAIIKPGGMGMGDVKLAVVLGMFLGSVSLLHVLAGFILATFCGGVHGVVKMALTKGPDRRKFPFGPALMVGAWVALVGGESIIDWYLTVIGLR